MNEIKIIIAGGRDFNNYPLLNNTLNEIRLNNPDNNFVIISGTANGADKLGEEYAEIAGLYVARFPADWKRFGKSAGYRRNEEMADHATHLVAFWDGTSKGTKHMIDIATRKELRVRVIKY